MKFTLRNVEMVCLDTMPNRFTCIFVCHITGSVLTIKTTNIGWYDFDREKQFTLTELDALFNH